MTRHFLIAGAAALALCACSNHSNQTKGDATPSEQAATPDAHPAATIPSPTNEAHGPDFVNVAAASDMFEIQSSRLARTRSHNADVRAFAQMMITAHTATTHALLAAIHTSGQSITPPAALPHDLQDKLDHLHSASAADFDLAYMNDQVDGHQNALNVMQRFAQDGDVPAIKTFAAATAPHVQEHLTRARAIRDQLQAAHH